MEGEARAILSSHVSRVLGNNPPPINYTPSPMNIFPGNTAIPSINSLPKKYRLMVTMSFQRPYNVALTSCTGRMILILIENSLDYFHDYTDTDNNRNQVSTHLCSSTRLVSFPCLLNGFDFIFSLRISFYFNSILLKNI